MRILFIFIVGCSNSRESATKQEEKLELWCKRSSILKLTFGVNCCGTCNCHAPELNIIPDLKVAAKPSPELRAGGSKQRISILESSSREWTTGSEERKSFRGESRKFRFSTHSEMAHPWSYVYAQMEQKPNPSCSKCRRQHHLAAAVYFSCRESEFRMTFWNSESWK